MQHTPMPHWGMGMGMGMMGMMGMYPNVSQMPIMPTIYQKPYYLLIKNNVIVINSGGIIKDGHKQESSKGNFLLNLACSIWV